MERRGTRLGQQNRERRVLDQSRGWEEREEEPDSKNQERGLPWWSSG